MKLYLLIIPMLLLQSCFSVIGTNNNLIIKSVENQKDGKDIEPKGMYRLKFENADDLILYTDTLYKVGDTLIIVKKK